MERNVNAFTHNAAFDTLGNWRSRGYLPHYDAEGKYQMLTYRLADSLPRDVLEEYWDRFIRDETHFNRAIRYIHGKQTILQIVRLANLKQ